MQKKLTERQEMVLGFIQTQINDRGYPPTLREIGNFMGIRSTNGVNDHLRALERKGYLTREDMKSRALRPTLAGGSGLTLVPPARDAGQLVQIPIVGRVAAGALTEAIEHSEDSVTVDRTLIGRHSEVFGLKVNGESMIEAGIHNGDFVFVRKQLHASKGEIIVALVGEDATCKYYYPEADRIRLQPANSTMDPIYINRDDWRSTQILGVVVGLYRRFN